MASTDDRTSLDEGERATLLDTLRDRFEAHEDRHEGILWAEVRERLIADPGHVESLAAMERTGGEPDVIGRDPDTGEYEFVDCSKESPAGRRSVCYDPEALASRKKNKPRDSAVGMATDMGVRLLTEPEYQRLQTFGPFDTKTSSWLEAPPGVRKLGGAIFGDHRFGRVFIYHNGAESYYAGRGFRCSLRV